MCHHLSVDGKEDGLIHCFKKGEPCASGQELLKTQAAILKDPERNPFEENILQLEDDVDSDRDSDSDSDSEIHID